MNRESFVRWKMSVVGPLLASNCESAAIPLEGGKRAYQKQQSLHQSGSNRRMPADVRSARLSSFLHDSRDDELEGGPEESKHAEAVQI